MMTSVNDYYQQGPYSRYVQEFHSVGSEEIAVVSLRQPAGRFPDPPIAAFNLFMVTGGVINTKIDLGAGLFERTQSPNSFVLAPPNTECQYEVDGAHELAGVSIPVDIVASTTEELFPGQLVDFGKLHSDCFRDETVTHLCGHLFRSVFRDKTNTDLLVSHTLTLLLHVLGNIAIDRQPNHAASNSHGLAPKRLQNVLEYIEGNLSRKLLLTDLAEIAGVSKYQFLRQFQKSLGISPYQFVIKQRIERATKYLASGKKSLVQIANALGFSDQSHFSRCFKKHIGVTPAQFIKSQ